MANNARATVVKTSFEAMFPRASENFAYDNPALKIRMQDAASKTLSSSQEDNKTKARKLFLLQKLSEPTLAPLVSPKLGTTTGLVQQVNSLDIDVVTQRMRQQGSWAQQKKTVENARQSMTVRERGASTVRKKIATRPVSANYDPNATALQLVLGDSNKFFPVLTLAHESRLENWGWFSRVQLMRDIALQLRRVHENGLAHHNLMSDVDAMLVDSTTFRGTLADPSGSVSKAITEAAQKNDVFGFGKTLLAVACRGQFGDPVPSFPSKHEIMETLFWDENQSCELDRAVRAALTRVGTPGSLLELCAQCCSLNLDLRPSSEDVWTWLDSILDDFVKAQQVDGLSAEDLVKEMQKLNLAFINSPRLIDLSQNTASDDAASVSTAPLSDISGLTDESLLPAEVLNGSSETLENRKSRLLDFLHNETSDFKDEQGSAYDVEIRKAKSLNLTSSQKALIGSESSSTGDTGDSRAALLLGATEAKENELSRRRSLDRGYMWAKAKLEQIDKHVKSVGNRTVKTDVKVIGEAWKVARATGKPRGAVEIAELFRNQERLPPEEASAILQRAENILKKEPNLLELKPPVIVFGDIHGQFFDLLNMLKIAGFGDEKRTKSNKVPDSYLFLGDYVDRGDFSCEVLLYLMSLKIEYPKRFFFLRGNHEARTVSSFFGFRKEAEAKYGLSVFHRACSVFQSMPIACLLNTDAGRWLCCHGGISPNVTSLSQFSEFNRFIEPGMNGFLCDLLWSDPVKDTHDDGTHISLADFLSIEYLTNPMRGCSYRFGFKSVLSFLAVNRLVGIIRAHEVVQNGYTFHFQRSDVEYLSPPVITVFSAPNYCGRYGNRGAMLRVNAKPPGFNRRRGVKPTELIEPIVFSEVSHPLPMPLNVNKQVELEGRIAETCPYMPTTFRGFLERSSELAHLQIELSNSEDFAKLQLSTLEEEPSAIKQRPDKNARPISFRSALPQRLRGMSAVVKKVTDPLRRFQEAAQNDSVNELNPGVLEDKVEKAKLKNVEFMHGLDSTDAAEAITVVVLPTPGSPSPQLDKNRKSLGPDRRPSVQTVSMRELRAGSSAGEEIASETDANENTITFAANEILALQLLFLLIDRQDKSAIDVEDLISWSVEGGHSVERAEAQACLNALDIDGDGRIGFIDYLSFAARAKDQWLLQKYVEVKIQ